MAMLCKGKQAGLPRDMIYIYIIIYHSFDRTFLGLVRVIRLSFV